MADPSTPPAPPRRCVLVVDNDAAVLRAMTDLLNGWNCDVLAASGPTQARALCEQTTPDLLVLDFHLDDAVTGLYLRQQLPEPARSRPCVIVTADHDEAIRTAVTAAGCHLLHKPMKPLALKSLFARLL